jgi:osmotically-inducible protein OsmY
VVEVMNRVMEEISINPHVRHLKIDIEYSDGYVVLVGKVRTYYQKQMAQEAVLKAINTRCPYLALQIRNSLAVA